MKLFRELLKIPGLLPFMRAIYKPYIIMRFRASFCDPFKADITELGIIESDKIIETFEKIPWQHLLVEMKSAKESDIYYSPSLEIENTENRNGISVSALEGGEWYIFFKRPKQVKMLFGLMQRLNNNYLTEIHGQAEKDVRECLHALIRNDLSFLENKIR